MVYKIKRFYFKEHLHRILSRWQNATQRSKDLKNDCKARNK